MARLVAVIDENEGHDFQRRQIPLDVDNMQMVVQFSDKCLDCDCEKGIKQKELESFTTKFLTLSKDEIAVALLVSKKDVQSLLSHLVPCVGCRKSVERLFGQLEKSQHPALEPLVITPRGELSIQHKYLFDPRSVFSLFHVHGSKVHSVVEAIPKSKKNKRCNLHSLETHKAKTLGCWLDAWDALSEPCREKVLVVDTDRLLTTVDAYLEKHKFCTECKSKVLLAYSILVGEKDSSVEKGYCAALYENLRCCAQERHVHVLNDTEFIEHLLEKAEPEFMGGSKRDRHAKTLDIAQEEVLTCLGIHIFERLHTVWQKLRSEEQTWLILFYIGMDALRKSYQVALEEKQGASNLELLCEELEEKEKRQVEKKEMKKQKRKQKKAKTQGPATPEPQRSNDTTNGNSGDYGASNAGQKSSCKCGLVEENANGQSKKSYPLHKQGNNKKCSDANFNSMTVSLQGCLNGHHGSAGRRKGGDNGSKQESCDGIQGSNDSSEDGDCPVSRSDSADSCEWDRPQRCPSKKSHKQVSSNGCTANKSSVPFLLNEQPSLQDLLEGLCMEEEDDDDPGISEEEILAFRSRQIEVDSKRQELRQNLKERFAELHLSRNINSV